MENSETAVWIDFAQACGYLDEETCRSLVDETEQVGRLIGYMIKNPDDFRKNL